VNTSTALETVRLWRPTGPEELALVEAADWREWPPRLPDQPIFYPVLNQEYATMIARDWNLKHSGSGYVTRFHVRRDFLDNYDTHQVGGRTIIEYWIPAEDLANLNANIVGRGRRRVPPGLTNLGCAAHQAEPICCTSSGARQSAGSGSRQLPQPRVKDGEVLVHEAS